MQEAVDMVEALPGLQAVLLNCCAPQVTDNCHFAKGLK